MLFTTGCWFSVVFLHSKDFPPVYSVIVQLTFAFSLSPYLYYLSKWANGCHAFWMRMRSVSGNYMRVYLFYLCLFLVFNPIAHHTRGGVGGKGISPGNRGLYTHSYICVAKWSFKCRLSSLRLAILGHWLRVNRACKCLDIQTVHFSFVAGFLRSLRFAIAASVCFVVPPSPSIPCSVLRGVYGEVTPKCCWPSPNGIFLAHKI